MFVKQLARFLRRRQANREVLSRVLALTCLAKIPRLSRRPETALPTALVQRRATRNVSLSLRETHQF